MTTQPILLDVTQLESIPSSLPPNTYLDYSGVPLQAHLSPSLEMDTRSFTLDTPYEKTLDAVISFYQSINGLKSVPEGVELREVGSCLGHASEVFHIPNDSCYRIWVFSTPFGLMLWGDDGNEYGSVYSIL